MRRGSSMRVVYESTYGAALELVKELLRADLRQDATNVGVDLDWDTEEVTTEMMPHEKEKHCPTCACIRRKDNYCVAMTVRVKPKVSTGGVALL